MNNIGLFQSQEFLNSDSRTSFRAINISLSCCSVEYQNVIGPRYDWERLGALSIDQASEANLMIISGPVNGAMSEEIKKLYDKMRHPKYVISFGACANSGGPFGGNEGVLEAADKIIPVDVYVPGCPPRPESLMHALLKLQHRIKNKDLVTGEVNA